MVTVIGAEKRTSATKGDFMVLELMGGIEMVQSMQTGRFYATARKCTVSSTFSEQTALAMIGQTMPGTIQRVQTDAYQFTVPETGEVIQLAHTWQYVPENASAAAVKALPSTQPSVRSALQLQ
jgi:hypothetical protein